MEVRTYYLSGSNPGGPDAAQFETFELRIRVCRSLGTRTSATGVQARPRARDQPIGAGKKEGSSRTYRFGGVRIGSSKPADSSDIVAQKMEFNREYAQFCSLFRDGFTGHFPILSYPGFRFFRQLLGGDL